MAVTRYAQRAPGIALGVVLLAAGCALLVYLRDPPWLITSTSGLGRWEVAEDGTRFRWTAGRASFFVPADIEELVLPVRSVKDTPADWPINAAVTVDDRPATRLRLDDESWRLVRIRMVPTGSGRRVRRIDIKLDRVRQQHRGVQLGEPKLLRRAR